MPLSSITVNVGSGGLGRRALSEDQISGMLFYASSYPSGMAGLSTPVNAAFSTATTGGTLAAGTYYYRVSAINAFGETLASAETSQTTTGSTSTVTVNWGAVTSATGYRIYGRSTGAELFLAQVGAVTTFTDTGALTPSGALPTSNTTILSTAKLNSLPDAVSLGITSTDSVFKGLNYQISEFFRLNPNGQLWIGVYPPGTYTFAEIKSMSDSASGKIRQMVVWAPARAYSNLAADLATIASIVATCDAVGAHMSVGYALNWVGLANWNSPVSVRTTNAGKKISVIIAQDGGGTGAALATSLAYSVPALGAWLGCLSKAPVNQSIGQPIGFNISNGAELETLALANGQLINTVGYATLGALKDAGYTIARKYVPQYSGSFFERVPTSTISTDDFAWIEAVRPVDKITRICESTLTPYLQSALTLNTNGTLSNDTIGFFQDLLISGINPVKAAGEISDFAVLIDPNQNVLSTSRLIVTIKVLETATAEFITINIGLTTSL